MPKLRNIIIFAVIAIALILVYLFFIKKPDESAVALTSVTPVVTPVATTQTSSNVIKSPVSAKDFLSLLLSVKSIKLDDSIFTNNAFASLHDSSITLVPDSSEGRSNPFANFGAGNVSVSPSANNTSANSNTNAGVNPAPSGTPPASSAPIIITGTSPARPPIPTKTTVTGSKP